MMKYFLYQFSKLFSNLSLYFNRIKDVVLNSKMSGNEKLIKHLSLRGDSLITPRKVDHWIYFHNPVDRSLFIESIIDEGFTIENQDINNNKIPYSLHISRIDTVDLRNVNNFTNLLESKANNFNGDYDGWETSVEINNNHQSL